MHCGRILFAVSWALLGVLPACRAPAGYGNGGTRGVEHVVLIWLESPSPELVDSIREASLEFCSIPGVRSVRAGAAIPSERAIVDDSFDLGIIVTLRDEEALQGYLDHPQHRAAAARWIQPHARRLLVYDIRHSSPMPLALAGG